MRPSFIVAALVFIALTPAAQANVTLDPGTQLDVRCKQHRAFAGAPFTVEDQSDEARSARTRTGKTRTFVIYRTDPEAEDDPLIFDAWISVTRKRHRIFRIKIAPSNRLPEQQVVTWRGCS